VLAAALAWLAAALIGPARLGAAEWLVTPVSEPTALQSAIAAAADGDTVRVVGGRHTGPIRVDRRLTLIGEGSPEIDGGGAGTVVDLRAAGIAFSGFLVRGSGASLDQENAGIAVQAASVVVEDNRLEEVLFGIYLREAPGSVVRGNTIRGMDLDLPRRGDAIRVWYSDGVTLAGNRVARSRDVVLWYSNRLDIVDNSIEEGRYGLHFMYCDDARIEGNRMTGNSVGAFLMYSRRLRLAGNTITGNHGPSGYGVGLKDMDDAVVVRNDIAGNRVGIFLDNSPREAGSTSTIAGNLLVANDFGVMLLPNVARAAFEANGFVENEEQVGISGAGGDPGANLWRGNYWSDYAGYDADGDGRGDLPYRSERLFESLVGAHPALRLFHYSPASEALDFAARAFPMVRPRPKLEDASPSLRRPTLASSGGADRGGAGLSLAALAMLGGAVGLLVAPWAATRTPGGGAVVPASEERSMIEVESLTKSFGSSSAEGGRRALDGVSFTVARGESIALWGPNGAGKTTALRALLGVISYDGSVRIDGIDPARDGRRARSRIGFIPQEIPLQGGLGVAETLVLYARLRRAPMSRAESLLDELGLREHAGKRVRHLSGGLRQRLALAVALLGDPPLLLLDEPSANLDDRSRRSFLKVLRELRGDKTIVFSTHRASEVHALADRVLVLEGGRLIGQGTPEEMLGTEGRPRLRLVAEPRGGADVDPANETRRGDHGPS
jgi:nitrous oxidase accessory protein